jgi:NAD-dependent dihydropyrimidine dehydrogenase PreA subunit
MPYVITETCHGTCDTACVEVCPVDCIHGPLPTDVIRDMPPPRNLQLYIDPEACISCGVCVAECPVDAIFDEEDAPKAAIAANAAFFATPRSG